METVTELFGAWPSEPSPALAAIPPMHPAAGRPGSRPPTGDLPRPVGRSRYA